MRKTQNFGRERKTGPFTVPPARATHTGKKHTGKKLFVLSVYLPTKGTKTSAKFEDVLDYLEVKVKELQNEGDVCIMGDMNGDMGNSAGPRLSYPATERGRKIWALCNRLGLFSVNSQKETTGPLHTFKAHNIGQSYIDYCLVDMVMLTSVSVCNVQEDCIQVYCKPEVNIPGTYFDVSDHLPVVIKLNHIHVSMVSHPEPLGQLKWQDNNITEYQREVHSRLWYLQHDANNATCKEHIDQNIESLVHCMHQAALTTVPRKKYNKHQKPFWNQTLQRLKKNKQQAWHVWSSAGRPRDNENELWIQYKSANNDFQKEYKRMEYEDQFRIQKELERNDDLNQKTYWQIINKTRKGKKHMIKSLSINDKLVTDDQEMADGCAEYFENLYRKNEDIDPMHVQKVEQLVAYYSENSKVDRQDPVLGTSFTTFEVKACIKKLKLGKAAGPDGITAEHVKYGGDSLAGMVTSILTK